MPEKEEPLITRDVFTQSSLAILAYNPLRKADDSWFYFATSSSFSFKVLKRYNQCLLIEEWPDSSFLKDCISQVLLTTGSRFTSKTITSPKNNHVPFLLLFIRITFIRIFFQTRYPSRTFLFSLKRGTSFPTKTWKKVKRYMMWIKG